MLIAEGRGAALAVFPPPHTFFFTREVDTNLGYVWYRKDDEKQFAFGIRQAEREEVNNMSRILPCSTRRREQCSGWASTSTQARIPQTRRANR